MNINIDFNHQEPSRSEAMKTIDAVNDRFPRVPVALTTYGNTGGSRFKVHVETGKGWNKGRKATKAAEELTESLNLIIK